MELQQLQLDQGATLAPDGIPLHFGDLAAEYRAVLEHAVLLNRSHEGRLRLTGKDRLNVMHRISTNDLTNIGEGEGKPTIFTSPTARILERATVFSHGDQVTVITEPGRGGALASYLQRNIFFNDDLRVEDITANTAQFALHGPSAAVVIEQIAPQAAHLPPLHSLNVTIEGVQVLIAHNKPLSGTHWTLVMNRAEAGVVWAALLASGQLSGLIPAGSLTYNSLRIRAGRPGVGRELTQEYIPLEVGLWDEVSFRKGCYTGQEIIARMESRNRLAKVMVTLQLDKPLDAPAELTADDRSAGTLTSSVTAPDGRIYGIAVVKTPLAQVGQRFFAGDIAATMTGFAGTPPPMVEHT